MKARGVFITGTDTGVGKTIVTALLLAHLRNRRIHAAAMKPVSAGDRGDGRLLRELMDRAVSLNAVNPVHFLRPLAPLIAARLERRTVDPSLIRSAFCTLSSTFSPVLVEGVGGFLVPLWRSPRNGRPPATVCDLVRELGLPLLIVARPGLGTINHTALTVAAARAAKIRVLGVVLNDLTGHSRGLAERTNVKAIEETCGVKVIAHIPFVHRVRSSAAFIRDTLRQSRMRREIDRVATVITRL